MYVSVIPSHSQLTTFLYWCVKNRGSQPLSTRDWFLGKQFFRGEEVQGGWFQDDLRAVTFIMPPFDLITTVTVKQTMRRGCKYRWNFTCVQLTFCYGTWFLTGRGYWFMAWGLGIPSLKDTWESMTVFYDLTLRVYLEYFSNMANMEGSTWLI